MTAKLNLQLSPKQVEYYNATNPALGYRFRCLAGSTGTGKTDAIIRIKLLKALRYNGIVVCWFRKNLTTIRSTTLPSIINALQDIGIWEYCQFRQSPLLEIVLPNGSKLWFREADKTKDPEYKKIRGLQIDDAVLEEADEMEEQVFSILLTRIGRWKTKEYGLPGEIDLVLNPSNGWVKELFYEKWRNGTLAKPYFFMEMGPQDNPYLPQTFWDSLEYMTPEDKERYLNNNWDYKTDSNLIIPYEWLKKVIVEEEYTPQTPDGKYKQTLYSMGVDPAGEGKDRTVYCFNNGHCAYRFIESDKTNKMSIARELMDLADTNNIPRQNVRIDAIGEGSGVLDIVRHGAVFPARAFKASHKPRGSGTFYSFANKRAENYWKLRELVQAQQFFIVRNSNVIKELTNTHYYQKEDGTIFIEKKEDIKKRIGASPDYADALTISLDPLVDMMAGKNQGLTIVT